MRRRGRPVEGVYGEFVDPAVPGALVHACSGVVSRATVYRAISLNWPGTLPMEVGSGNVDCWLVHPDWLTYDPCECPPVTHQMSVAASIRSFAAARHQEGYALRSENARLR